MDNTTFAKQFEIAAMLQEPAVCSTCMFSHKDGAFFCWFTPPGVASNENELRTASDAFCSQYLNETNVLRKVGV